MLDVLVSIGQFLSIMGLVYGLGLTLAYRERAELRPARVRAHGIDQESMHGHRALRAHRAASRAVIGR